MTLDTVNYKIASNQENIVSIVDKRIKGVSVKELALEYRVSIPTIYYHLNKSSKFNKFKSEEENNKKWYRESFELVTKLAKNHNISIEDTLRIYNTCLEKQKK